MRKIAVCLAISASLFGCASAPSPSEKLVIEAGDIPTLEASEVAVRAHLAETLKDPDSIKQFKVTSGPAYLTWYRGLVYGGGYDAAYLVCFEYNAKNSYGGYVGVKTDGYAVRKSRDGAWVVPVVNWGLASRRC